MGGVRCQSPPFPRSFKGAGGSLGSQAFCERKAARKQANRPMPRTVAARPCDEEGKWSRMLIAGTEAGTQRSSVSDVPARARGGRKRRL